MKIAISGKGGVGKTSILAMLAYHLKQKCQMEVLLIDADPSPHMAQTIGVKDVSAIKPIADMKDLLTERSGKTPGSPFYNINPQVDDLISRFMVEQDGLKLMVLGAIETGNSGCACAENTVLRRLLTKLLLKPSQAVLLDMEAGVEHLGRGTIAGVDHLLVVVIPTNSSVRTAQKITRLANEVGIPRISYVGNLVRDADDEQFLTEALGVRPIACFPDSEDIRKAERRREPLTQMAERFSAVLEQLTSGLRHDEKIN